MKHPALGEVFEKMDEKLMKQIVEAVMQELMAQRSNASGMYGRAGQASGDW